MKETVVFGGGCFWCVEAVFQMLRGVVSVESGYAGGHEEEPSYVRVSAEVTGHAEVVQVVYDPAQITFHDLLTVYFASHDPTTVNRQGNDVGTQYRSVIFYTTDAQRDEAEAFIQDLQTDGLQVVTQLTPLERFYKAEEYHQNYYQENKQAGYCQLVIEPKLEKVQKSFAKLLKEKGRAAEWYTGCMEWIEALAARIKGEVDTSKESLEKMSRDASLFVVQPQVVVSPKDTADIEALVQFATEKNKSGERVTLTARAAGTDMSGGPLTDSVVVSMTSHFNHIESIFEDSAVVEPGVYFRDFDRETQKHNLELPSYTASRELNTIGGMIANNSGGEKNLRYGKTAQYVRALDVVLADGKVHHLENKEGEGLQKALGEEGFLGDVYRRMAALVSDAKNRMVIEKGKPTVSKNSAGYALWDMGDGVHSLDLARLMVGAQGTLGIITKAEMGLVVPQQYGAMTVVFVKSLAALGTLVPHILSYRPDSFESYDDHTFSLATRYFPELAVQMKSNLIRLGLAFLPEVLMVLSGGVPKMVLLVEFRAETQAVATAQAEKLAQDLRGNTSVRVRVADSDDAARKYWTIRRESFNLLRQKVRGKRTAPFIDDFVVPPPALPEFLPKLEGILSQYQLTYTVAGHVGDGNFHIIPLIDPTAPGVAAMIDTLSHQVYDLVLSYKGSISGEHNDGLVRTPYSEKMFGPELYALFEETKKIFDPLNIFNPGKKVGTSFADAARHLDVSSNEPCDITPHRH